MLANFIPVITEKSLAKTAFSQFTFKVNPLINSNEAAKQLEALFTVNVTEVNVINRLGKKVSFGKKRIQGMHSDKKIMIFTLKKGQKIDLFDSAN